MEYGFLASIQKSADLDITGFYINLSGSQDQSLRASGLNLVVAAIVLWNTVYLENAVNWLKSQDEVIPDEYLQHLSPMGWEHINLIGDYIWNLRSVSSLDNLRPLRTKKSKL